MTSGNAIAFLDVEASGLGARSWPIEIGWCFLETEPVSVLIKPHEKWPLEEWEKTAESLHGVSMETLIMDGQFAGDVCDQLNAALGGKRVFSDSPDWDSFWLYRLFDAAKKRQNFTLDGLGAVFSRFSPEQIDAFVEVVTAQFPRRHRAAADCLHMRALYRLAKGQTDD
ncbi:MAG: hypothetical protein AAGB02_01995 [Pseudomonadota bacterium]